MTDPSPHTTAASSALAKTSAAPPPTDISSGVFSGIAAFEAAQRMAQALCSSTMVPSEYRGQQGLSNSLIALEIAARMGLSPLVVMQNMTPIHGKPSWSSSFLIATVNASGRFTPLRFVFDNKDNPSSCHAVARDKATGEVLEGQTISIEMAKREGWWLTARHIYETHCAGMGLRSWGGQGAMGAWGYDTNPSPLGIPCPAACCVDRPPASTLPRP